MVLVLTNMVIHLTSVELLAFMIHSYSVVLTNIVIHLPSLVLLVELVHSGTVVLSVWVVYLGFCGTLPTLDSFMDSVTL